MAPLPLSQAIATLASGEGPEETRLRALFDLSSAIRWPMNPIQSLASDLLLARYLGIRLGDDQPRLAAALLQQLDLSNFVARVTSFEILDLDFEQWDFHAVMDRTPADIVRFLLTWTAEPGDKRSGPSIKKAHFFLGMYNGFGHPEMSWRRFAEVWQRFKPVSALLYVNQFQFGRRLFLDPREPRFDRKVNAILADQPGLVRVLGCAKYV
jgi:hypothetical protein